MKKYFRRTLVVLILLWTVNPVSVHAVADNNPFSLRSSLIDRANAYLVISNSGNATVDVYVRGNSSTTKLNVIARLQRYSAGNWITIKTFTKSVNSRYLTLSESYSLSTRGTYRVSATVTANGWEKTYPVSASVSW